LVSKEDIAVFLGILVMLVWALGPSLGLGLGLMTYTPSWTFNMLVPLTGVLLLLFGSEAKWGARNSKGRKKRRLNLVILVTFLITLFLVIAIPDDTYGNAFIGTSGSGTNYQSYALQIGTEPRITYQMSVLLSSIGGLSAGKGIYMEVHVKNISPANWNDTYCCLSIVGSGPFGLPPKVYLAPTSPSLLPNALPFTLKYQGNGTYYTDGHFYVTQPTVIWVGFGNPAWNGTQVVLDTRAQLTPVANISGTVSDSQSVALTEVTVRIGFIFGSFSILIVQPILERLFIEERDRT
jgi:hypothetical protein